MAHWPHSVENYKSESARSVGATSVQYRYHYCSDELGALYLPGLSNAVLIYLSFAPLRETRLRETGFSQRRKGAKEDDESNSAHSPSSGYRPVSPEQQHGADNGSDPSCPITRPSPQHASDECSDKRAGQSDEHGHNDAPWFTPRHQQLRNHTDQQPKNYLAN